MRRDGVLLLGGAGFIGSAVASRLKQEKMTLEDGVKGTWEWSLQQP